MALPSFCRDTVTVTRAPMREERGTSIRDWANAVAHEIAGCSVQPAESTTDRTEAREAITVRCRLFLPPGADIDERDRVTYNGRDYALDGAPLPITSPTGAVSHIRADLVDWRG